MSTPYQFTPRLPAAPHSTPHTASAYSFSKPKASRAPILNPYDKFTQPEFDVWIGGITNALRRALGQEGEEEVTVSPGKDYLQAGVKGDALRYPSLDASDNDDVAEDSFADIQTRRAKGKARDPREGPGLGKGDRVQPIEIVSSDEEEEDEVNGLANGEDQEGATDEEEKQEDEEDYSESEHAWERGQGSSQPMSSPPVKVGPPRKPRPNAEEVEDEDSEGGSDEEEEEEEEEEEIYEEYEEDYEGEDYEEEEEKENGPPEVIDILDSDDEDARKGTVRQRSFEEDADDEHGMVREQSYDEEEEEETGDYRRGEEESVYSEGYEDKENRPAPGPPMPNSLDSIRRPRESPYDEYGDPEGEEEEYYEEDEEYDEEQPLDEDTSFPPRPAVVRTNEQLEIRDPWAGPRAYAEDLYSGGSLRLPPGAEVDPNYLGSLDNASSQDVDEEDQIYEDQQDAPYEVQPLDHDISFPPREISPEIPVELPNAWEGPQIYAEDYYSGGDVRTFPGQQIDPSLLNGTGDDDIDGFLTPGAITPHQSDLRSQVDDEEGQESDASEREEVMPQGAIPSTTPTTSPTKRGEPIPQDAEIIALDDSDEEQGEKKELRDTGEAVERADEEFDELEYNDDERVIQPADQVWDFFEQKEYHQEIVRPDAGLPESMESMPFHGLEDEIHSGMQALEEHARDVIASSIPLDATLPSYNKAIFEDTDGLSIPPTQNDDLVAENVHPAADVAVKDYFEQTKLDYVHVAIDPSLAPITGDDNFDDIYGSPVPEVTSQEASTLEQSVEIGYEVSEPAGVSTSAEVEIDEADEAGSTLPALQQTDLSATAYVVAQNLATLHDFGQLPTPPSEERRHKPLPNVSEDALVFSQEETYTAPFGDPFVEQDGSIMPSVGLDSGTKKVDEVTYDVFEDVDNEQMDDDADGEADYDVEVLSVANESDGWGARRDDEEGFDYSVEEPLTEGRLTAELSDRGVSLDVESVAPARSVTPDGLRDAVKGMGQPSKVEVFGPPPEREEDQEITVDVEPPTTAEPSDKPSSPKDSRTLPGQPDVPMPVTADENVPDPAQNSNTPAHRQRNFILSLPGTPKFFLSPVNTPRPAGEPVPVSVSVPHSILRSLGEGIGHLTPGPSVLYPPVESDGLFTPAEFSVSVTPEDSLAEMHNQSMGQIAEAIYGPRGLQEEPEPAAPELSSQFGLNSDTSPSDVDQLHENAELPSTEELTGDFDPGNEYFVEASVGNGDPPADDLSYPAPSALPLRLPSTVMMHAPLSRKPTDPILMADPYPYSLSTPGAALELADDEPSPEEAGLDNSLSSASTMEKEEEKEDVPDESDILGYESSELLYPPEEDEMFLQETLDTRVENAAEQDQTRTSKPDEVMPVNLHNHVEGNITAEDAFKLMGSDSIVAPSLVKDDEELDKSGPQSQEVTSDEVLPPAANDESLVDIENEPEQHAEEPEEKTTNQHETESHTSTVVPPAEPTSSSSKKASKRKRDGSPDATKPAVSKRKGKKSSKGKGKAKEVELPTPERPEGDSILVRPRTSAKPRKSRKREISEKPSESSAIGSSSTSLAQRMLGPLSRASSVASSGPSDKSFGAQPSPTTNKPHGVIVQPQPVSLFHAHGQRRKNSSFLNFRPPPVRNPSSTLMSAKIQMPTTPILTPPIPSSGFPFRDSAAATPLAPTVFTTPSGSASAEVEPPHSAPALTTATQSAPMSEQLMSPAEPSPIPAPPAPIVESAKSPSSTSSMPPPSPIRQHAVHPPSTTRSTRSQCRYRRISLPKEEGGPRICFLVPGCSLTNRELIEEEDITDHGDATYEDSLLMIKDIESLNFDQYLIGILRQLVGLDILREGEVFYLPQPGEQVPQKHVESLSNADKPSLVRVPIRGEHTSNHGVSSGNSASALSPSTRPPVSNADSTSTSLSFLRKVESEKASSVAMTESEPESSEGEEPSPKRVRPSPPEEQPATEIASSVPAAPPKRRRGRPRKHKDTTYQPREAEEDSQDDSDSKNRRKPNKRGVKRTRTVAGEEGEHREPKKLRLHLTAPAGLSAAKDNGDQSQPVPPT